MKAVRNPVMTALLIGAMTGAASAPPPVESFALGPGVVWDQGRGTLVMMAEARPRPSGKAAPDELALECVDPATGRTRWRSRESSFPLLVHGGRLLAWKEGTLEPGLPLVLLDAGTGRFVRRLPRLKVPRGTPARAGEGMGSSFELTATASGNTAFVTWTAASWYVGGVNGPANRRSWGETVAVDLAAGTVLGTTTRFGPSAVVRPAAPPDPWTGPSPPFDLAPWEADGVRAEVVVAGPGNGQTILLRRWQDEETYTDLPIGETKALYHRVWRSVDGRHLLLSRQVLFPPHHGNDGPNVYQWTIYSVAAGRRIAEFRTRRLPGRFLVAGDVLVCLTGPGLAGFTLSGGEPAWTRSTRDLRYHGEYPP